MKFDTPETVLVVSLLLLIAVVAILLGEPQTHQTALLPSSNAPETTATDESPPPSYDAYGIERGAFALTQDTVQTGETFADLLTDAGVPYQTVVRLAREARPDFDVRRLRSGKAYRLYQSADSLQRLRYFVYHRDPINYVVIDLRDSLRVLEKARRVNVRERTLSVQIAGSLYGSITRAHASPQLASKLADMYAWQIDFFRIQPGDEVQLIYEQHRLDGEPVGLGNILAARFNHLGNDFYGFYFAQNGDVDYFDEEGQSLRKAFLKAPLDYDRISSGYSKRRYHPILKRYRSHLGTDYAADSGTPIHSVGDGIVVEAEYSRYNGNYVKIRHNATYSTQYLHMSKIEEGITPGERVEQEDVIGYVGETGLATGPHLCYRFWQDGKQVDPYEVEIPSADPVDPAYMDEFKQRVKLLKPRLDEMAASTTPSSVSARR